MRLIGALCGFIVLTACQSSENPAATPEDFGKTAEQFVYGSLALSPVAATAAGYHEHNGVNLDEQVDDYSPQGIERQRKFYNDYRARLQRIQQDRLSAEDRADYEIIDNQISLALLELDTIQSYRHNPTLYVELAGNALNTPYMLEYAPAPKRFQAIIARMRLLPKFFEQAKINLSDAPEVWNRVAREEDNGNIGLVDQTLRQHCPAELKNEYAFAAAGALTAFREFDNYLKSQLSQHTSDWRLGKEVYARKFQYTLGTGRSPEQVLADAESELKRVRANMAAIAKPRSVEAALDAVAQRHATPATYLQTAKSDLAQVTQFVKDKHLVPLPSGGNLQVIPTPEFMRGIYAVGGFNPAPPLEPQLGAYYWVTPIPENWPRERIESKLREYNTYGLKILTIHEAMPGHYVQLEYANRVNPKTRRIVRSIFGNGPYVEGWAVYATEMVIDNGYDKDDPGMQLTWGKQLLRVIANTILDIRMQTMGMTDEQALDLMIRQTYQEKEEATAKLQRAKLSSTQLPTYFVGWRGWLQVRDQYRQAKGAAFQLATFHEDALKEGAVPLPILGRLLTAK